MSETGTARYGETQISYSVARAGSTHTKARIHVDPDGSVQVLVPDGTSAEAIARAVRQRAGWIHRHQSEIAARSAQFLQREWVSGESHRYLGRRYMLKITVDAEADERVALAGGQLRVRVKQPDRTHVRKLVLAWYRRQACDLLRQRVSDIAQRLPWVKVPPPTAIREMRSQWGSCSPAGRLTLNPVLIRAPRDAIDYVIVHELCHLRHHDHSRRFYTLLTRYVPGWTDVKHRLDGMAEALFAEQMPTAGMDRPPAAA